MSDRKHFIRNFEYQPGAFTVYMALVLAAGDMSKPPTEQQELKFKWLEDETCFKRKKIMDAIRHMKNREVLLTDERMDTFYYRFTLPTHAEIVEKLYAVRAPVVQAARSTEKRNLTTHYFNYLMNYYKGKDVNISYCVNKIRALINDFHSRKLADIEIDHYFRTLAHKLSEGANIQALLTTPEPKSEEGLTKIPKKVVGWSD